VREAAKGRHASYITNIKARWRNARLSSIRAGLKSPFQGEVVLDWACGDDSESRHQNEKSVEAVETHCRSKSRYYYSNVRT
jgi:hypothetical protein